MTHWGGEGLIESGVVASFAHPGANVTGVYMLASELEAKRLELLLRALPPARKVAILNPGSDPDGGYFTKVRQVAQATKIELYMTDVLNGAISHGGLIAYGPVFVELQRLVASYVDRILKGANPSNLPVEQPKRFELVVNLKAAKAAWPQLAPVATCSR